MSNPRLAGGGEGDPPPKAPDPPSYAAIVGRQTSSQAIQSQITLPFKKPGIFKGEPALYFTEEESCLLATPHRFTLIAKCSYGRPPLDVIKAHMKKSEGLRLAFSVGILYSRHLLFRFSSEEDFLMIWLKEVVYIKGYLFRFFKWTPSFESGLEPSIVPIWVSFLNLPIHLFNNSALESIGSILGKVLKIDGPTKTFTRPSVARVCIEMDILKKNPDRFWLGVGDQGRWQQVEYEKKYKFCLKCKKLGHDDATCSVGKPGERKSNKREENSDLPKNPKQQWIVKNVDSNEKIETIDMGEKEDTNSLLLKEGKNKETSQNIDPISTISNARIKGDVGPNNQTKQWILQAFHSANPSSKESPVQFEDADDSDNLHTVQVMEKIDTNDSSFLTEKDSANQVDLLTVNKSQQVLEGMISPIISVDKNTDHLEEYHAIESVMIRNSLQDSDNQSMELNKGNNLFLSRDKNPKSDNTNKIINESNSALERNTILSKSELSGLRISVYREVVFEEVPDDGSSLSLLPLLARPLSPVVQVSRTVAVPVQEEQQGVTIAADIVAPTQTIVAPPVVAPVPLRRSSRDKRSAISSDSEKMSIVAEAPDFLQVFSDGLVKRFAPEISPASPEFSYGFRSKDVIIDLAKPISARLFLPDTPGSSARLPVLVYFHGGGFCIGSTTWLGYHHFLGDFCVTSQSIVVSIDYRLAPENRLPIAYDDCFSSLDWLSSHVNSEPWLERADLSRIFLSGDSAGGNIAHHVALQAMRNKTPHLKIMGLLLIHPYFGSERRTKVEMAEGAAEGVKMNDMFWRLSLPEGSNRDHFACNLEMAELSTIKWHQFPEVVVYVAGLDLLKERGVMYAEFLKKKGVKEVKLVEAEGESHVYHVFHPKSEATCLLQQQMSEFMNAC
ncbi:hypothetical protein HHK36_025797 [Tetracentron sinense]|uniref:Alpha/beta hydrolase fold-3 domain-containing protein n=1 Tax=Tetracentron sinense TaxID=13715 RepID=A0A834YL68_TETSI|nr:hypothetical protein HHK36_025797 [Tetracentron sinense]